MRLGGTALAQVYGQIGNESPDLDDSQLFVRAFQCIQRMVAGKRDNVTSSQVSCSIDLNNSLQGDLCLLHTTSVMAA